MSAGANARPRRSSRSPPSSDPMSHGACRPVARLGARPDDSTARPTSRAWPRASTMNSMDLLQAAHTWSGVEMALWDVLGKARGEPVWRLLGYRACLSEDCPTPRSCSATRRRRRWRAAARRGATGFRAVKFGWGPFGRGTLADDADHLDAAREGLGPDGILLVDAGQIFGEDVEAAAARCRRSRQPARPGSRSLSTPAPRRLRRARRRAAPRSSSPAARPRTMSTWRAI